MSARNRKSEGTGRNTSHRNASVGPQAENAIAELVRAIKDTDLTEAELDVHTARAIRVVQQQLEPTLCPDVMEAVATARELRRRYLASNSNYSVLGHMRHGGPGPLDYHAAMLRAVEQLRLYSLLIGKHPKPDGYSTAALCQQAEIGKDLWSKIIRGAGVGVTRKGDHGRHFSNSEIRKLIAAAERHGTPKSRAAAERWSELIRDQA